MIYILKFGIGLFNFIYLFLKLLPTKKKIVFLSRQSDVPSTDIRLLVDEIQRNHSQYRIVVLCKKIPKNFTGKIGYCFHMFSQAYHLATSQVAVLDSYSILASCLHHKKSLLIIQMWHSVGTMKKFGYSVLDKAEGSSSKLAYGLKMHNNYDYIFASSEAYKKDLSEGFNAPIEKILTYPLPRVELLKSQLYSDNVRNRIFSDYPILKNGKENIVYCPTFRKTNDKEFEAALTSLINCFDYDKCNLILKLHPLDTTVISPNSQPLIDNKYSTFDMLFISDKVISDYSCIIYEAAILNKPLYFYTYDYAEYMTTRDIYMDYKHEIPGPMKETAESVVASLHEPYDMKKLKAFADKYVSPQSHDESKAIIDFIFNHLK